MVGVTSSENREVVMREGTTSYVDYKTTNLADRCGAGAADTERFDVVYDCASGSESGENYKTSAVSCLREADTNAGRKHGQYVAINGPYSDWVRMYMNYQQKNQHLFLMFATTKDLDLLTQLVDEGWSDGAQKLRPKIMKVLSLTSQAEVVRSCCRIQLFCFSDYRYIRDIMTIFVMVGVTHLINILHIH